MTFEALRASGGSCSMYGMFVDDTDKPFLTGKVEASQAFVVVAW